MEEGDKKIYKNFVASFFLVASSVLGFLFFGTHSASAASLYFSPSSGSQKPGATFSVGVYLSSTDQAANAAQGTISFSNDTLEVVSLSKSGSIVPLWLQEPSFSNASGSIKFEGIIFNPGYQGSAGKLITINLKAKASGTGTLAFVSGSVLANDGQGTNILKSLGSAKFTIAGAAQTPPSTTPPGPVLSTLEAPTVTSSTHPNQDAWYSSKDVTFSWDLPKGVKGVSYFVSESPTSIPSPHSDGLVKSYSLKGAPEGTSYFHIRYGNDGGFGPVSHFRFNIDSIAPSSVTIQRTDELNSASPIAHFSLGAVDDMSGIKEFRVKIDNGNEVTLPGNTKEFASPELDVGKHELSIQVIDKAGNSLSTTQSFEITLPVVVPEPAPVAPEESFLAMIGNVFVKHSIAAGIVAFLILVNLLVSLWPLMLRLIACLSGKKCPPSRMRKKRVVKK